MQWISIPLSLSQTENNTFDKGKSACSWGDLAKYNQTLNRSTSHTKQKQILEALYPGNCESK